MTATEGTFIFEKGKLEYYRAKSRLKSTAYLTIHLARDWQSVQGEGDGIIQYIDHEELPNHSQAGWHAVTAASIFSEGMAWVKMKRQYGFIDKSAPL